jgi:hypothetical protein
MYLNMTLINLEKVKMILTKMETKKEESEENNMIKNRKLPNLEKMKSMLKNLET